MEERVDDAAGFISVVDDLRPLDDRGFNPCYEIWSRLRRVPPAARCGSSCVRSSLPRVCVCGRSLGHGRAGGRGGGQAATHASAGGAGQACRSPRLERAQHTVAKRAAGRQIHVISLGLSYK